MFQSYLRPGGIATGTPFPDPVSPPASDPLTGPFVCLPCPRAYLPVALGALRALVQPFVWDVPDDATRNTVLDWMDTFIGNLATADYCMQSGTVNLTIAAGTVMASATVTFPLPFASTADVVVAESTGLYIASSSAPSSTGCSVAITAPWALAADGPSTLTWLARAHG